MKYYVVTRYTFNQATLRIDREIVCVTVTEEAAFRYTAKDMEKAELEGTVQPGPGEIMFPHHTVDIVPEFE